MEASSPVMSIQLTAHSDFPLSIAGLHTGAVDACAEMQNTQSRKLFLDFTDLYFNSSQFQFQLAVLSSNYNFDVNNLQGKRIGKKSNENHIFFNLDDVAKEFVAVVENFYLHQILTAESFLPPSSKALMSTILIVI